jgi:hypothetical protein
VAFALTIVSIVGLAIAYLWARDVAWNAWATRQPPPSEPRPWVSRYGLPVLVGTLGIFALVTGTMAILDAELSWRTKSGVTTIAGVPARAHGAFIVAIGATILAFLLPEGAWRKRTLRSLGVVCALLFFSGMLYGWLTYSGVLR